MTAREFRAALKPLGRVEIYEVRSSEDEPYIELITAGGLVSGPYQETYGKARDAFLEVLRWLQVPERRV